MKNRVIILCLICLFSINLFSQNKETFLNITFLTSLDEEIRLSDIKTQYTIIYFYNPECENCTEIKKKLIKNKKLNKLIGDKTLTLIAILPDVEKQYWQKNFHFIPNNWINAWIENDKEIISKYLKTLPAFFVLDANKNILNATDEKQILKLIEKL
ncbi:MAG: redoxin domain-containing protein [Bacteroidales bacterium]|jgi:thioredoxin-related protein|nr:redoxin domain-containing protein [Bacteroidales bacterium]